MALGIRLLQMLLIPFVLLGANLAHGARLTGPVPVGLQGNKVNLVTNFYIGEGYTDYGGLNYEQGFLATDGNFYVSPTQTGWGIAVYFQPGSQLQIGSMFIWEDYWAGLSWGTRWGFNPNYATYGSRQCRAGGNGVGLFEVVSKDNDLKIQNVKWQAGTGITFTYHIAETTTTALTVRLYSCTGPSLGNKASPPIYSATLPSPAAKRDVGFTIPNSALGAVLPAATTHLLVILDEDGRIGDSHRDNNHFFLPDVALRFVGGLSPHTRSILKSLLRSAGQEVATITSTFRSPTEQARVMFDMALKGKSAKYAAPGESVLAVYRLMTKDKTREQILAEAAAIQAAMTAQILTFNPTTQVSKHCADPRVLAVLDIDPKDFPAAASGLFALNSLRSSAVSRYLGPSNVGGYTVPFDPAFHLEIPQPQVAPLPPSLASAEMEEGDPPSPTALATAGQPMARPAAAPSAPLKFTDGMATFCGSVSTAFVESPFTAEAGNLVSIGLSVTASRQGLLWHDEDAVIYLLDSERRIIATSDDDLEQGFESYIACVLPKTGTYTLVVTTFGIMPTLSADGRLEQWNGGGGSDLDFMASLILSPGAKNDVSAPSITSDSVAQVLISGSSLVQYVSAAGGSLTYQWSKDKLPIKHATGPVLSIPQTSLSSAGKYEVKVTNAHGTASQATDIAIVEAPDRAILLPAGATATLALRSRGQGLQFSWEKDGQLLTADPQTGGVNSGTLTLKNLTVSNSGVYKCRILGANGEIKGGSNSLIVYDQAPEVTLPPEVELPSAMVGRPYSFQIPFQHSARQIPIQFSATGLPSGLTLDKNTGLIAGTPTAASPSPLKLILTASNKKGASRVATRLAVLPLPSNTAGSYHGLIARMRLPGDSEPLFDLGGSAVITVGSTGAVSGVVKRGSRALRFTGAVVISTEGNVPSAHLVAVLPAGAPRCELELHFELDKQSFAGELILGTGTAQIRAVRSAWSSAIKAPATVVGTFHAALSPALSPGPPQGTGFLILKTTAAGISTWYGRLADGSAFTGSAGLGFEARLPVHTSLYADKGSLQGWAQITSAVGDLNGTLDWNKHPQPVNVSNRFWKSGFPLHDLAVTGGRYASPPKNARILDLSDLTPNATISFSLGGLAGPVSQPLSVSKSNVLTVAKVGTEANPRDIKPYLNVATGQLTGTFWEGPTNSATKRKADFYGLLVPRLQQGIGFFLLPEATAAAPYQSGVFTFSE